MERSQIVDWLADSDPSLRWQVLADLGGADPAEVGAVRSLVASQGWGAELISRQAPNGQWGVDGLEGLLTSSQLTPDQRRQLRELHQIPLSHLGNFFDSPPEVVEAWESADTVPTDDAAAGYREFLTWTQEAMGTYGPKWVSTTYTLLLLVHLGIDPDHFSVVAALDRVEANVKWVFDDERRNYFDGETEACCNGMVVATGSYFGRNVEVVVERLLADRKADGGWNCYEDSSRSSFDSTLCVLEGLLEYQRRFGGGSEVAEARHGGEEYLLERKLFRRLSDGEVADPRHLELKFPPRWQYDILRSLDYMRDALAFPDDRCAEAVEVLTSLRSDDGRWPLFQSRPGRVYFEVDGAVGEPSRWNTFRALRVLDWFGAS